MIREGVIYISRRNAICAREISTGECFSFKDYDEAAVQLHRGDKILMEIKDNLVVDFVKA